MGHFMGLHIHSPFLALILSRWLKFIHLLGSPSTNWPTSVPIFSWSQWNGPPEDRSKALLGSLFPGVRCRCFLVEGTKFSCLENAFGSKLNNCLMWRNSFESKLSLQITLSMTQIENEILFLQRWKAHWSWDHEICFYLKMSHCTYTEILINSQALIECQLCSKAMNSAYGELQRYTI